MDEVRYISEQPARRFRGGRRLKYMPVGLRFIQPAPRGELWSVCDMLISGCDHSLIRTPLPTVAYCVYNCLRPARTRCFERETSLSFWNEPATQRLLLPEFPMSATHFHFNVTVGTKSRMS